MEAKHTKEYAEKLAKENFKQSPDLFVRRNIYVKGYMKAIEEISAPEMLDALFFLHNNAKKDSIFYRHSLKCQHIESLINNQKQTS